MENAGIPFRCMPKFNTVQEHADVDDNDDDSDSPHGEVRFVRFVSTPVPMACAIFRMVLKTVSNA